MGKVRSGGIDVTFGGKKSEPLPPPDLDGAVKDSGVARAGSSKAFRKADASYNRLLAMQDKKKKA